MTDCEIVLVVEYVLSLVCVVSILGLFVEETEVLPEFEADDEGDCDLVIILEYVVSLVVDGLLLGLFVLDTLLEADIRAEGVSTIDDDCLGLVDADRLGLLEADTEGLGVDDAEFELDFDPDGVKPGETVLIEDDETDCDDI